MGVCVEAGFKVVPLSHDRFKEVAGIDTMPANWRALLAGDATDHVASPGGRAPGKEP